MPAVSNSSPLIALEQIGQVELLRDLFQEVLIPDSVAAETRLTVPPRPWIVLQPLRGGLHPGTLRPALGSGEREAISLALELEARTIIIDDDPARRIAGELGLNVVERVQPHLDSLLANRFFMSPQLYQLLLRIAGEPRG